MHQLGPDTLRAGGHDRALQGRHLGEVLGLTRVGEMAPQPAHPEAPRAFVGRSGSEELAPLRLRGPVATEAGVHFEVHGGLARGIRYRIELVEVVHPEVDVGGDGFVEGDPWAVQPGEDRCLDPGRAQLERFGDVCHAEPVRARRHRGPGHGHGTVPVAAGLDHGHQSGVPDAAAKRADVVGHRLEIDPGLAERPGHPAPPAGGEPGPSAIT